MQEEPDYDLESTVVAESKEKLEEPSLFKVLLHNDDFTTMEFVVYVLQSVFQRSETESVQVMLQVHMTGTGVAGIYPHEIAEMKAEKVISLARDSEYPLLCTVEAA